MQTFQQAFSYMESIKSRRLPFVTNLYCTSVKRPTSFKRPVFKSRGWPFNRGPTVDCLALKTLLKSTPPCPECVNQVKQNFRIPAAFKKKDKGLKRKTNETSTAQY